MTPTRRERHRQATITEIKEAALALIGSGGSAALSVRGVARAIGMSPAGLYRYYDSLDALITELVTDAYDDLADAVGTATAPPGTPSERLLAGMLAYRRWCLDRPNQFLLVFGTPIPGYAAPEHGPTVRANRRIGGAFFDVVHDGWRTGALELPGPDRPPTQREQEFLAGVAPDFPAAWLTAFIGAWAHFHGMVTLEILGQLDWLYPDGEWFFRAEVGRLLASWEPRGMADVRR